MANTKKPGKPADAGDSFVTKTVKSTYKAVSGIARSIYGDAKPPAKKPAAEKAPPPKPAGDKGHPPKSSGDKAHPPKPAGDKGHPPKPVGDKGHPPKPQGDKGHPPKPQGDKAHPPKPQGDKAHPPKPEGDKAQPPKSQGDKAHPPQAKGDQRGNINQASADRNAEGQKAAQSRQENLKEVSKEALAQRSSDAKGKESEKPEEKTSLSSYVQHLKDRAKTTVNDEIERVKHTVKVVEDNLYKVEKVATQALKDATEPKQEVQKEQQKPKQVELNKLTSEQRLKSKQFEYTDEKTKVTYKYDTKTGDLQETRKGDTTTQIKYDKSGKPSAMEIKQGNHVLASLENSESSKLKIDQVTGAVNVEAVYKDKKSHVAKESTTYQPDGTVTNVGFDSKGNRTSKVAFAIEGDQLTKKYRVDYVYTQGEKEKPGEVFSVTRNLEEKNPAKQVTEKCWYENATAVERQTPSIKEKISRDAENNTKVTRAFKDGRSEELRLDAQGNTTEFHVRNAKGYSVKYEVKNDKIVAAKVDGEDFKDAKAQEAAQHDLSRMKRLYHFQIKAAEAEKVERPVGLTDYAAKESKTGTIVIETDDGIHTFHSQYGEIRDKNKTLIGHLDKDNKLTLEKGVDLKIGKQLIKDGTSLEQLEGSSFFDTHNILNNSQSIESNGPGKNGVLIGPDGQLGGAIIKNNVFDKHGEFLGKVDSTGTLTRSVESGKGKIDINSELRGYAFVGKEAGEDRRFIMSQNMSNGSVSLGDPPKKHTVEMGMILEKDENGKIVQKGLLDAPSFASGKLDGGTITLFNGKEPAVTKPLCQSTGTVLDLEIKGEGAVKSQRIQAVCLGQQVLGPDQKTVVGGGFFDVQDAKAREKQLINDANTKFQEKDNDFVGKWGGGLLQLGGKSDHEALKESAELAKRRGDQKIASLDKIMNDGTVDLKSLGFYNRELEHLTQTPQPKTEQKKPDEPKTVLKRPELKDKSITGKARVGNEVINFQKNKVIINGKAVGEVGPDYVIRIEGRPPIDLKQEDRVLMQFKFDGAGASNETHQLIGLGRTKVGLNGRMYEGGLVDTQSLSAEATSRMSSLEKEIQTYKDGRHLSSGISNWALGDAEGIMDQHVETFRNQRNGLNKEFKSLFNEGFDPKNLDNNRVDQCMRATQQMMENCRTTTADAREHVQRTTQLEQQGNEGLVMAATTIGTMGVGALFNGLANAGKLANLSRVTVLTSEVGATSLVAGGISVVGRHTEKGGLEEAQANLASGTLEGMANSLNAFGTMMKAQNLGKAGIAISQLSKAEVQVSNLTKATVKVEQLTQGEVALSKISKAMVSVENLQKAGLTTSRLAKAGITAEDLQSGAVSMERLLAAGLKEKDLAKVTFSVGELGKHSLDLRKVPVALEELQKVGVPLEQLAGKGITFAGPGDKMFTIADQMLLDSKFGQFSMKLANNPMANGVLKNSLRIGEGAAQTFLYEMAAGMRSKEGIELTPEKIAMGTLFNVGSQSIGEFVGGLGAMSKNFQSSDNAFLKFFGTERNLSNFKINSRAVFNDFASESFNQFASRLPNEVSSAYANGCMSAINDAVKNEKQRIAEKLGHPPTEQELYENMNYTRVLKEIHDQGVMAAASSPLMSLAGSPINAWSEKGAPISRLPNDRPPGSHHDGRTTSGDATSFSSSRPDSTPPHSDGQPSRSNPSESHAETPQPSSESSARKSDSSSEGVRSDKLEDPVVAERQKQALEALADQHTKDWKPEYGKELGLKVIGKEGTERQFLEATRKASDALCNSGEPGDTRPIRKDMFHDVEIVKSALANNPEQLKIYNEYVDKRRKHEETVKDLNNDLESRRADIQHIVDSYCRSNDLPPIQVTRTLDMNSAAKGYRNGKLNLPMNWLLKSRLGEAELSSLHAELQKVGRENETPEYRELAAIAKFERQRRDFDEVSDQTTRHWRNNAKEALGLTAFEADERFNIRQELTRSLVNELCVPGVDGKPIIEPTRFHDIDYVRSKLDGEQLARYETYVTARENHEKVEANLRAGLDERLRDLQEAMDRYCDAQSQPRVTLNRTHHLDDSDRVGYFDGKLTVSSRELLKSRPSDALKDFIVQETADAQQTIRQRSHEQLIPDGSEFESLAPPIDRMPNDMLLRDFDGNVIDIRNAGIFASVKSEENAFLRHLKAFGDNNVFLQKEGMERFLNTIKEGTSDWFAKDSQTDVVSSDTSRQHDVFKLDRIKKDTPESEVREIQLQRAELRKAWSERVSALSPQERQSLIERRREWLENCIGKALEGQGMCRAKIEVMSDKDMGPGTAAFYRQGTQTIFLRESQVLGLEPLNMFHAAHESFHLNQDVQIVRSAALAVVKDAQANGITTDLNDPDFRLKVLSKYADLSGRLPNPDFIENALASSQSWVDKRATMTDIELKSDVEYQRGLKLGESSRQPRDMDADVKANQQRKLINLLDPGQGGLDANDREIVKQQIAASERAELVRRAIDTLKLRNDQSIDLKQFEQELQSQQTAKDIDALVTPMLGFSERARWKAGLSDQLDREREQLETAIERQKIDTYLDKFSVDAPTKMPNTQEEYDKAVATMNELESEARRTAGTEAGSALFRNNNPYDPRFLDIKNPSRFDKAFVELLGNHKEFLADKNNQDFFKKLVDCSRPDQHVDEAAVRIKVRQDSEGKGLTEQQLKKLEDRTFAEELRKKRVELRKEWLKMLLESPTQAMPLVRLDHRAITFMLDHFKTHDQLGTLKREDFKESLPYMVRELVRDHTRIASGNEMALYRANYYEWEAHLFHQRLEAMARETFEQQRNEYEIKPTDSETAGEKKAREQQQLGEQKTRRERLMSTFENPQEVKKREAEQLEKAKQEAARLAKEKEDEEQRIAQQKPKAPIALSNAPAPRAPISLGDAPTPPRGPIPLGEVPASRPSISLDRSAQSQTSKRISLDLPGSKPQSERASDASHPTDRGATNLHQQQMREKAPTFKFEQFQPRGQEGLDKFLHLHMKVDKHSVLQKQVIREFARRIQVVGDNFTPVDSTTPQRRAEIVNERLDALKQAHVDAFGEPAPEIQVLSDSDMRESGAAAGYLRGRGITQLRESEILGLSPFSPKAVIHEGVHVNQDHAIIKSIAADLMRKRNINSFDELKDADGNWTRSGRELLEGVQREYKSRTAFNEFVPLNENFFEHSINASKEFLEKSAKLSDDALGADPEYVRGRRLANDLFKKEQRAAERQADLKEKIHSLARALTSRHLGGEELSNYLNALLTQQHGINDGANPLMDIDPKVLLKRICENPLFRSELVGNNHHLDGGIGGINKKDRLFENLLYKAVSDNEPPDFLSNMVDAALRRAENPPQLDPVESRRVWLKQMEDHLNDFDAAPSTPKALNRAELRAYAFLMEHFSDRRNGSIGNLTRERFEEALPVLMQEMIKDNIKEALLHDQLVYFGNLAEAETRHTDAIVDEWAAGRGTDIDDPLTERQRRLSQKVGKFWLTGDRGAQTSDEAGTTPGVMHSRMESPLERMMRIQRMQTTEKYGDYSHVEQGDLPENYVPYNRSDAATQKTQDKSKENGNTSDNDGQNGGDGKKRLQDRSQGQKNKDGSVTGEKSDLPSGNELADMPQKPTQVVGDVPKQQQYPLEYHANLEANRLNRLNIHRQLAMSNPLGQISYAQDLMARLSSAPSDLHEPMKSMALSYEKSKVLETVWKYHDPQNLPQPIADAIRNEGTLTYAEMRDIVKDNHPSDLDASMRLTETENWKEAIATYKNIDTSKLESDIEKEKFNEIRSRLESKMRSSFDQLLPYLEPPKTWKGATTDAYIPKDAYAVRFDPQSGRAQEAEFSAKVSNAINSKLLSDRVVSEQPHVLSKDKALVDLINRDMATELAKAQIIHLKRGVNQADASRRALLETIQNLTDKLIEKDDGSEAPLTPVEAETLRAIKDAEHRGKDWIGVASPEGCILDNVGCDYLLINKVTGEYYPLDFTIQGVNKTPDSLVDCRALNPNLTWSTKQIPTDREKWILSVPEEKDWHDAEYERVKQSKGDHARGTAKLNRDAEEELAIAILATIQTPSRLNVIDHPLPPNMMSGLNQDKIVAAKAIVRNAQKAGMFSWANDLVNRLIIKHLKGTYP